MSQANVNAVREVYEAWTATRSLRLDRVSPEVEWSTVSTLDGGVVLHGHKGVRGWFRHMQNVWEDVWWEIERLEDLGDRVLTIARASAQGRGSGVPVDMAIGTIWTFEDGKIVRVDTYMDPAEAVEAAGLEE